MDLRERLSDRIHIEDIHEILRYVQGSQKRKSELYGLIFDPDETIGYQALWACSHFSADENKWLYDKQDELINEILVCKHPGKRRLLLNLLLRQPQANPPRVDFLNFCLDRMLSAKELPGVQTLCMKRDMSYAVPFQSYYRSIRHYSIWRNPIYYKSLCEPYVRTS